MDPFESELINQLILEYAKSFVDLSSVEIVERWHGVYPKSTAPTYVFHPEPGVTIVNGLGDMHSDHQRIKDLFTRHKNVRACLSGHVHYVDAIDYLGVRYLCNGAVSGNWWREPLTLDEFPPVYALIDLFEDGTLEQHLSYYNYSIS